MAGKSFSLQRGFGGGERRRLLILSLSEELSTQGVNILSKGDGGIGETFKCVCVEGKLLSVKVACN